MDAQHSGTYPTLGDALLWEQIEVGQRLVVKSESGPDLLVVVTAANPDGSFTVDEVKSSEIASLAGTYADFGFTLTDWLDARHAD